MEAEIEKKAEKDALSSKKEILVVFKDRRRPISFQKSDDPQVEYARILEAVKETFEDVLLGGEGSSECQGYYLQRESKVWGRVDLNSKDEVEERSQLYLQISKQEVGGPS